MPLIVELNCLVVILDKYKWEDNFDETKSESF